jgi:quinol monooxygenase YgiN
MKSFQNSRSTLAVAALGFLALMLGQPMAHAQNPPNPIIATVENSGIDTSKPFVLVVQFEAKPGQGPALEKAFAPAIAKTRQERGCLQYDLSRDSASAESYLLYERWNNLDDLKAHLATEHIAELGKALADVRTGPPQARVLAPVGTHP